MALEIWTKDLEARHLAELTFPEVTRALRALSSTYVERRAGLAGGAALSGAGKRAAFALFYAPLHYLLVDHIVRGLHGAGAGPSTIVDLGCGTGAAGAAWGYRRADVRRVLGIDRNPWALREAERTYRTFGLEGRTRQGNVATVALPRERASIVAAFTVNELGEDDRNATLTRLLDRARSGDQVLIVEPIARSLNRWWEVWRTAVESAGGRSDEWRFAVELPAIVAKLDRAAGLRHRELTGRSLWLPGGPTTTREDAREASS